MKESYLTKACRKTVSERFPEREAVLNFAFEKRLSELRSEHAGSSKERLRHLESQIIPGIFAKQTPKFFGNSAALEANEIRSTGGVWRIDMTR